MERKHNLRYRMLFGSSQLTGFTALMGVSFFLRIAYFLGYQGLGGTGFGTMLLYMILPLVLEAAFVTLIRGFRLNAPGVYGILGAVYCVLLLVQSFFYTDLLRTVLGVIWYALCAVVVLTTMGGILRSRTLSALVFVLALVVRFFCFDLRIYILDFHPFGFLKEAAALCALAGFTCLIQSVAAGKNQ